MILNYTQRYQILFHFSQASYHNNLFYNSQFFFTDYSDVQMNYIVAALVSCDSAFSNTKLLGGELVTVEVEQVDQNIVVTSELTSSTTTYGDRVKTIKKKPTYRERLSAYYNEVSKLAIALGYV